MTGSASNDVALVVLLVAAAAISAVRLARGYLPARPGGTVDRYLTGRDADAAHLVMNLAMVAMLGPWWTPTTWSAVLVALGLVALCFVALLALGAGPARPALRAQRPAHVYHLLAALAMIYATALMRPQATEHHTDPAMGHMTGPTDSAGVGIPALTWTLAGLFALDLVATAILVTATPRRALAVGDPAPQDTTAAPDDGRAVRTLRVAAVPHGVMDLAMITMLVAVA